MDKKRLAVNMAAQLLAFAVNMGISFFLARIIEEQIGENTYGFVNNINTPEGTLILWGFGMR